jgi:hypothetical protein
MTLCRKAISDTIKHSNGLYFPVQHQNDYSKQLLFQYIFILQVQGDEQYPNNKSPELEQYWKLDLSCWQPIGLAAQ